MINRIYAIFIRQVYLVRDNITRFVQMFIWGAVDVVLWGFISKYLGQINSGLNFVSVLLGAILLWDFLIQVMQGITMSFFEDVWARNFLNIFGSPLRNWEYLTGLVLVGVVRSLIALTVMLIFANLVFGLSIFVYGIYVALFVLILFLFGISLGIIGLSIVLRLGPSAEWFIWPIPAFLSPFVGVIYPLATLPSWMQFIGHLLPASYVFEGIRNVMRNGVLSLPQLFLGMILAILYIALAYFIFLSVYKKAVRTGLIARYSSESVS